MRATIVGGPAPFREAVELRLIDKGHVVQSGATAGDGGESFDRFLVVLYCDTDARWEEFGQFAKDPGCVAIAVVPVLDVDLYITALLAGASGVVYGDTSSLLMAETIQSAIAGEVTIPRQAAQHMAALARREKPPSELDDAERRLLAAVAAGKTIVALASELHYSERTVRRHLQSLYIKLGVKNRAEAIAVATRIGLTEPR